MPNKFKGISVFRFETTEQHKQFAMMLIQSGVSMSGFTKAMARIILSDSKLRQRVIGEARK